MESKAATAPAHVLSISNPDRPLLTGMVLACSHTGAAKTALPAISISPDVKRQSIAALEMLISINP
jgi:hypothetical protein